jgi:hypothetical protein
MILVNKLVTQNDNHPIHQKLLFVFNFILITLIIFVDESYLKQMIAPIDLHLYFLINLKTRRQTCQQKH